MEIIHEISDGAILRGAAHVDNWIKTRNALFLFDAIRELNAAEEAWIRERPNTPLRHAWQELRRAVMLALEQLGNDLISASTPAETEQAIYPGRKRATLARIDQQNDRAVTTALTGSTLDQAVEILEGWGKPRSRKYLKKRASQLGLTKRKPARRAAPSNTRKWPSQPAQSPRTVSLEPGRRRHHGSAY